MGSQNIVETSARLLDRALDRSGPGAVNFTRVYADRAMADARRSQVLLDAGRPRSPIEGLAISIKDLFDVAGETTCSGARALLSEPPALADAAAVARLRAAGAVLVGRTNMTQFALSCLGLNPDYGTPLSPWNRHEQRIAGGSSSGAAASVADGMATAALGTDTGGSIRVPASYCGLVGFKPTKRRVDVTGTFSLSRTLDSIGPIAHDVATCIAIDRIVSGAEADLPAIDVPIRLGLVEDYLTDGLDAEVAAAFDDVLRRLARAPVTVQRATLPELDELPRITAAGGGFSPTEGWAANAELFARVGEACDPRVMSRFAHASRVTLPQYFEMLRVREEIARRATVSTQGFDAILFPTVPIVPPRLADLSSEASYLHANARSYHNAFVANALDRCAITIPCHRPGTAPVGLSLMGGCGDDDRLLAVAAKLEPFIRAEAGNEA